ncbi:hypothetical protein NLU13_8158 [Sarocladium strictum]|uniref:Uncharacterized protein n=1 Tax=Sarocladium strictum TaxID=5046 RepID=A0AA39GCJ8_SARSR|nr:hypothetical protein NLU13_8158 [Sarocladium strictum]
MTSNMNSLKVPDSGLRLQASGGDGLPIPPQAFFLTLEDNAIENMIRAVQSGQELSLKLGSEPTLKYGSNTHIITPPSDSLPYDLYLTRPFESTKSAERLPCTGSLFRKPKSSASSAKPKAIKEAEKKSSDRSKGSSSSGLESDYETLRDGLAAEEAARGRYGPKGNSNVVPVKLTSSRTQIVDKALAGKRGTLKNRGLSPASLPPSPALRGVGSPSGPVPSASQQAMERSKYYRAPLVHELAVEDRTLEYLREKWDGNESEMLPALNKIADQQPDGKTWTMRRAYYKELDVYSYAYDASEEREKAIKNAVKAFDKMRLSSREPEWERLNAPEDRGKGICLSSLQAKIATKEPPPPAAPKNKVQKGDDGSSKDEGSTTDSGKTSKGGESMARSSSNPLPTKAKKPNTVDAQAKRLLSNKPKPATSSTVLKPSPTKGKGGKSGDGRILSQEIIEDSDVSDDETPALAPKSKPVAVTAKPTPKEPEGKKARPVPREPTKPAPAKRQREDDDSSSSSGTPLAKRIKGRTAALPLKPKTSQTLQRPAAPAPPPRAKDTSPTKSSPLASSPPTNVSDMDDATPPPQPIKKRHNEMDKAHGIPRKKYRVITEEVITLASRFKTQYARYVKLHREIEASANPSQEDIEGLTRMRNRLATMKSKIHEAV